MNNEPFVRALEFEEKCEADAFIFWAGQVIEIPGNLTGHVEVLINEVWADAHLTPLTDWPVIEYFDPDGLR